MGRGAKALLISIIIAISIVSIIGATYYYNEVYLYKDDYLETVVKASSEYEVDIYLVYAIIKVESSFRELAVSSAGAVGLMQIMPATADYIKGDSVTYEDLTKAELNIDIGVRYLQYLGNKFESDLWVIIAYNAGETKAREWMNKGISPYQVTYKESREYLVKVTKAMKRYKELYYLY